MSYIVETIESPHSDSKHHSVGYYARRLMKNTMNAVPDLHCTEETTLGYASKDGSENFSNRSFVVDNKKCERLETRRGHDEYVHRPYSSNPAVSLEYIEPPKMSFHGVGDIGSLHSSDCNIISNSKRYYVRRKICKMYDGNTIVQTSVGNSNASDENEDFCKLSSASLATTFSMVNSTNNYERQLNEVREESFKKWLARKEKERKEKEQKQKEKQMKQLKTVKTPEEREAMFRLWLQKKFTQAEIEKAEIQKLHLRRQEAEEAERMKKEIEKLEKGRSWINWKKNKEEVIKEKKLKKQEDCRKIEKEREEKRLRSQHSYEEWLRSSKNKALPVPLNQGELSMRGSVSSMYINPIPWHSAVDT